MFYRIVALFLVLLGIFRIVSNLSWPLDISPDSLDNSSIGLATIFVGLLNLCHFYSTSDSVIPKIVVLGANLMFIGFSILLVTSGIDTTYGYIGVGLSLINCVMVLNHKV